VLDSNALTGEVVGIAGHVSGSPEAVGGLQELERERERE
jgi:hypothetical protein